MRKLFACSIADVPPLHLNSRNDMSRPNAVRITASPCAWCFFCICLIPTVVSTVSVFHTKAFVKFAPVSHYA